MVADLFRQDYGIFLNPTAEAPQAPRTHNNKKVNKEVLKHQGPRKSALALGSEDAPSGHTCHPIFT